MILHHWSEQTMMTHFRVRRLDGRLLCSHRSLGGMQASLPLNLWLALMPLRCWFHYLSLVMCDSDIYTYIPINTIPVVGARMVWVMCTSWENLNPGYNKLGLENSLSPGITTSHTINWLCYKFSQQYPQSQRSKSTCCLVDSAQYFHIKSIFCLGQWI